MSRTPRLILGLIVAAGLLASATLWILSARPRWRPLTAGTIEVALAASALAAGIALALALRYHVEASRRHRRHAQELAETSQSVIGALVFAADSGHDPAAKRIRRLQALATEVAMTMGLPAAEVAAVRAAVLLRNLGAEAIERSHLPGLLARVVRARYEKFDGTGGPDGLRGEDIPAPARVLAAVERFESLVSAQGYRPAVSEEEALAALRDEAGTICDPDVVRLLITAIQRPDLPRAASTTAEPDRDAEVDSATDELTRLPTPSHLFNSFEQEVRRAARLGTSLSVIELDIDGFARINDSYGRTAGDRVLRGLARALRSQLRPGDTCVRYAGDDFILILSGVDAGKIEAVAARIEQAVLRHKFAVARGRAIAVEVNLGCASFPGDGRSCEDLIAVAEARMKNRRMTRHGRSGEPGLKYRFPGRSDVPVN